MNVNKFQFTPGQTMKTATHLSLEEVLAARRRVASAVALTPCRKSPGLSQLTGCEVFCKEEYSQATGSFKERGARNALSLLAATPGTRGVIAASAGNHALGLARHGRVFRLPVTVVMPCRAPRVKIDRCRRLGARVILHGQTYQEASRHAADLGRELNLANVHPFDDLAVMAGQGTLALELLEQVPDLDAILVPVGGGGLLAGISTVLRALKPKASIIGVEPENAACFGGALKEGKAVRVSTSPTLADGLAVAQAGQQAFAIAGPQVDRVVSVSEEAIARAIWYLAWTERAVVEGAGAVGLAALLEGNLPELANKRVVLLLTGRNIDPVTHRRLVEPGNEAAFVDRTSQAQFSRN
jgi:threonine dehydratase